MKKIRNFTIQHIELEGFGMLEIEEGFDGGWKLHLAPIAFSGLDKIHVSLGDYKGGRYYHYASNLRKLYDDKESGDLIPKEEK